MNANRLAAALALSLLSAGTVLAQSPSATPGATQIAILVDISGSTSGFEAAIEREIDEFVDQQRSAGETFGIAAFVYGKSLEHFERIGDGRTMSSEAPSDTGDFTRNTEEEIKRLKERIHQHEGGGEGVGNALEKAFDLDWSPDPSHRRLVVIFGNETFDQGNRTGRQAIQDHEKAVVSDQLATSSNPRTPRTEFPVVVHVRYVGFVAEGRADKSWRVQELTSIQRGENPEANGSATAKVVAEQRTVKLPPPVTSDP